MPPTLERTALRLALDPVELMAANGMTADAWQAKFLRSKSKRILALCARQTGKSTVCAVRALHAALFTPKALVLLVSPSLRQSNEIFRKVLEFYRPVSGLVGTESESVLKAEFCNGSRVISLPGESNTIRGFSAADLVVADEGARIEDRLYFSIRPSLAVSDGRLIAASTGWLRAGWFHSSWTDDGDEWERYTITASECPRISAEFLKGERAALGDLQFRAEYMAAFVDSEGCFFDAAAISRAFRPDIAPLFPDDGDFFVVRDPAMPPSPRRFVVGLDPASRIDYAGIAVVEPEGAGKTMTFAVRHVERLRGFAYPALAEKLKILLERLGGTSTLALDATGLGGPVTDFFREAGLKARIVPITSTGGREVRHEGGAFTVPKRELIGGLGLALETNRLKLSATMKTGDVLRRELESYTVKLADSGHESYSAPPGQHDDLISALALGAWLAQREGSGGFRLETGRDSSRWASLRRSY